MGDRFPSSRIVKHNAKCNVLISVYCYLIEYFDSDAEELISYDLKYKRDYYIIYVGSEEMVMNARMKTEKFPDLVSISVGVNWLKAHCREDYGVEI